MFLCGQHAITTIRHAFILCQNNRTVTPNLAFPKICLAGPILAEKAAKTGPFCWQNWSNQTTFGWPKLAPLPKLVPHGDQFWPMIKSLNIKWNID